MHNKPHSAKTRKLISEKTKLAMSTPEMSMQMSKIRFGKNRPEGLNDIKECKFCKNEFKRPLRVGWKLWASRLFCSRKCMGKAIPQNGENNPMYGRKASLETRLKMSKSSRGEKAWNWKGGIGRDKHGGWEYKQWRSDIFTRDNWTCQTCKRRGVYLEAHHIKSYAKYPNLRYELNNGVSLCRECHKLTDNYKGKGNFK